MILRFSERALWKFCFVVEKVSVAKSFYFWIFQIFNRYSFGTWVALKVLLGLVV